MEIIRDPLIMQKITTDAKINNQTIGFVPTMGALHNGHLSIIEKSCRENQLNIVSIFVNPTQFNQQEDFEKYPQDLEQDCKNLSPYDIDFIFAPNKAALYTDDYSYSISEKILSPQFCGASRPGHFEGMLTVVMKLLNIVQPTRAYFGEKDFQQLQLVQGLVKAFFIPTEIVACPTIRDEQGLALSSRNSRLDREGIAKAREFAQILKAASSAQEAQKLLQQKAMDVDYVGEYKNRRLGAVVINGVRLIDNAQI